MRETLLPIALCSAVLAACSPDRAPASSETAAAAPSTASTADATRHSLPEAGEASGTPVSNTPDGSDAQARFDGYGEVKLGAAPDAMQAAWGGQLKRLGGAEDTCYFMIPKWVKAPAEFAFMIEAGAFVRYSTESAKFTAPGGGKVGMTTAEILALYPGRVQQQPHKYTDGQYLRIKDTSSDHALVFETDAGKVMEWRVGSPPQVDYVEGCS